MEFFRVIEVKTQENKIQNEFDFHDLGSLSEDLFLLNTIDNEHAEIGTMWGEFTLQRTVINEGLRFALLECPNALTWTVTTGKETGEGSVLIHLTINRKNKDQEFIEEIRVFLDDQCQHIKGTLQA